MKKPHHVTLAALRDRDPRAAQDYERDNLAALATERGAVHEKLATYQHSPLGRAAFLCMPGVAEALEQERSVAEADAQSYAKRDAAIARGNATLAEVDVELAGIVQPATPLSPNAQALAGLLAGVTK